MESVIKKRHLILISLILLLISGVALVTYARQIWKSTENTTFDTTIGDIAGVKFMNGDSINVTDLGPVLNYHDGANVEFVLLNRTNNSINVSVTLNITSISNNLKNSDFKWVLEKMNSSHVYEEISSGDFSGFVVGNNVILSSDSVSSGYAYYKFYVYIDGSVSNNSNLMSNSLNSVLVINAT